MNELYAADPAVCGHASELKLLLASFGPYTGRYLANYPIGWGTLLEKRFENLGEVEAARVKLLLQRAKESISLITKTDLPWGVEKDWLANALPLMVKTASVPAVFDGLIATQAKPPAIQDLHELDFSPTAEERIAGTVNEYARVTKILLLLSPELAMIDPYLNPLNRYCFAVLEAMFNIAAKGKCRKITLWARASTVIGYSTYAAIKTDLEKALNRLALKSNFRPGREIEMLLVEDESRRTKMHGRYLLSIKGGIRLDQGFQQLPEGRHVDVGPIGKNTHSDLLDIYFDEKHDMRVAERLVITL
jgi:hypothetical protein